MRNYSDFLFFRSWTTCRLSRSRNDWESKSEKSLVRKCYYHQTIIFTWLLFKTYCLENTFEHRKFESPIVESIFFTGINKKTFSLQMFNGVDLIYSNFLAISSGKQLCLLWMTLKISKREGQWWTNRNARNGHSERRKSKRKIFLYIGLFLVYVL